MAGQTVELLPRTELDFNHLSTSSSETRVLVGKIPTAQWTKATLMVRVHNATLGTGNSVTAKLVLDASTDEDASNTFVETDAIPNAEVTVGDSSSAGDLLMSPSVSSFLGYMAALRIDGATGASVECSAEISVVLVMKD